MWSYSVMVITKDSESFNPGSSPGRTFFFFGSFLERQKKNPKNGKSPVGCVGLAAKWFQQQVHMPECPRGLRGQT